MSYPVFGLFGIRVDTGVDVFNFRSVADTFRVGTTVVDVYVPSHILAEEITHQRCTFIIQSKISALKFNYDILIFDSPPGFRHWPMASFVFLLRVSYTRCQRPNAGLWMHRNLAHHGVACNSNHSIGTCLKWESCSHLKKEGSPRFAEVERYGIFSVRMTTSMCDFHCWDRNDAR